jgi:DNA-binding PadR family transcriptional regulator
MAKAAGTASRMSVGESKLLRDFFLGFVKIHVLHHASREPIYGVWFLEELARHGYRLSPGTLYPLFHDLEATGFLEREDRVVEGKVRKYYVITPLGERALGEARDRIRELVDEIVQDDGIQPSRAARSGKARGATR